MTLIDEMTEALPDLKEDGWRFLPEHLRPGVASYVMEGFIPGDFLQGVISNDLRQAAMHADGTNRPRLPDIVSFFVWYLPWPCQGSPEKMNAWSKQGGWKGLENAQPSEDSG